MVLRREIAARASDVGILPLLTGGVAIPAVAMRFILLPLAF